MKQFTLAGIKKKIRFSIIICVLFSLALISCEPERDKLGVDIFPPSDTIMIYTDTIGNIEASLVRSRPWETSLDPVNSDALRTFFLGSIIDTLTGLSTAEIVTEYGLSKAGIFGEEPRIDSLTLSLYFSDVIGDTTQEMHISIYEFLDSLDMDSIYFNDYDITGKYNPVALVDDEIIVPKPNTLFVFNIDNQDYLNRIIEATNPADSIFIYPSKLQRNFPGLYIKTETVAAGGALAKVQLSNVQSGLRFKYQHDNITLSMSDTIPYSTYTMSFSNYYVQKVNIFKHDFTGTYVEKLLDNPDVDPQIGYVQGMAGISMKVTLPDLYTKLEIKEGDKIAVNAARLLFYVIPDSISGIKVDDYPDKLMMDRGLSDGTYLPLYDYIINISEAYFGRLTQSNEQSAFLEPVYYYTFNIGRHLQSVLYGEIENSDLIIYMDKSAINSKIIKFWCNYPEQERGLRLELIYTKF